MKKFISMFLVLTMVVTTLMGVIVMDVNAATSSEKASKDTTTDKIMIPFGASSLKNQLTNMKVYGRGDWYAYGYSYSDEDLAKDPGTTTINGTKTEEVNFLSTSYIKNPLFGGADAEMIKFDWKEATITDESKKALDKNPEWFTNNAVSANYLRVRILSPRQWTSINPSVTANYGKITEDVIYQYTFYAYTDPTTCLERGGTQSKIEMMHLKGSSEAAGVVVYSDQVASAYGVPHKIDVIFSGNTSNYYVNVYVDGVQLSAGKSTTANTSEVKFEPRFGNMSFKDTTSIEIENTDWYITSPASVPGTNITPVIQNDVKDDLITVPKFFSAEKVTGTYRNDDYITGVIDSLEASISDVLETTKVGDKIIDIDIEHYDNPASLFDSTVADPTVKLISRTTGEEVDPTDATGTLDNYYFMVKGIYIIPEKSGIELSSLDYNEDTKVATLNYQEFKGTENIPFVLLVGAYDANDRLLSLDVSDAMAIDSVNEDDGVKKKTFTADFGTLDLTKVSKYKVFAFNSLLNCNPIVENYSTPDK